MARWSGLVLIILLCMTAARDEARAQGAATGGTKDVGTAPTVIFRSPDEPSRPTAVPNNPRPQQRVIRLRRPYLVRSYGWRTRRGY